MMDVLFQLVSRRQGACIAPSTYVFNGLCCVFDIGNGRIKTELERSAILFETDLTLRWVCDTFTAESDIGYSKNLYETFEKSMVGQSIPFLQSNIDSGVRINVESYI